MSGVIFRSGDRLLFQGSGGTTTMLARVDSDASLLRCEGSHGIPSLEVHRGGRLIVADGVRGRILAAVCRLLFGRNYVGVIGPLRRRSS